MKAKSQHLSAADRRWQRRYERIRRRKEEEDERKDCVEFDAETEICKNTLIMSDLYAHTLDALYEKVSQWLESRQYDTLQKDQVTIEFSHESAELVDLFEGEEDLEAGDASELDAFIGEFLAPGT